MTPIEAYRAAIEAAATLAADMKAPVQDAANIAIGLPTFSQTVAALIRALPEPEGLDDTDTGGTKCRFCGGRDDETALPVPDMGSEARCNLCGQKYDKCLCWDPAGAVTGPDVEAHKMNVENRSDVRNLAKRLRDTDSSTLASTGDIDFAADELNRLRAENEKLTEQNKTLGDMIHKRGNDLATRNREVKKLRAENERLRAALKEIARPKVGPDFDWKEAEVFRWRATWYAKYQEIARAALKGGE